MNRFKLQLLAIMGIALAASLAAQTTAITYQGHLTGDGLPATGLYDLAFTLFDASEGGGLVSGPITHAGVPVSNGLFTVTLDFGPGVLDGGDRWLELGVATLGGEWVLLSPRQPLTSVPYAVQAAHAASAASVAAGNITGTLAPTQLPATIITNGASGVNISGTFSGNGAGVTNVSLASVNTYGLVTVEFSWGNFTLSSSPGAGDTLQSITAADVNGDGHLDLISVNRSTATLTVLTNMSNGSFALSSSPGTGATPEGVTAADVNGDGHPDLISANRSSATLTVLTNDGRGGFVLSSSPGVGLGPQSVTAADINGDGPLDLISANYNANTLTVLTNDGSGGFVLSSSLGQGTRPYSVTAADVNGDGPLDLISANYDANTLTVLTNDGHGGFVLSSAPSTGSQPQFVTTTDVNGDGHPDLISANSINMSVLTNDGSGGFVLSSSPSGGGFGYSATAADVNGDGWVDLITADLLADTLSVLTNDGNGGFVLSATLAVGDAPVFVIAADVNGDGQPDLVSANLGSDSLSVLFNTPVAVNDLNLNLDVANITGTFGTAQIPDLDAAKITSGTLATARIPNLDASHITTGALGDGLLSANVALLDRSPQAFNGTNTFAGRVGIGTTSPQSTLHVAGPIIANGDVRPTGIAMPGSFGPDGTYVGTAGNYLAFSHAGGSADPNLVVGGSVMASAVLARGGAPGDNGANKNGFAFSGNGGDNDSGMFSSADGQLEFYGNNVERMRLTSEGNVGIGTTSPTGKLQVDGFSRFEGRVGINTPGYANSPVTIAPQAGQDVAFVIQTEDHAGALVLVSTNQSAGGAVLFVYGNAAKSSGGSSWAVLSDERLKQKIRSYDRGLDEILKLRTVRFEYRDDPRHGTRSGHEEFGLIAQEVEKVFPEAVSQGSDGYRTLDASPIQWAAINAIQELNQNLDTTLATLNSRDAEITELKKKADRVDKLESRLSALEKLLSHQSAALNGGAK